MCSRRTVARLTWLETNISREHLGGALGIVSMEEKHVFL
jgi:hypothetical protein